MTTRIRPWWCRWWPPRSSSGVLALRYAGDRRIDAEQREIATSVANQAAVAIKKVQLIDRLTERNAIKDLLEDLSHGNATSLELEERAAALGSDLAMPHLVLQAVPRPGPAEAGWESVAESLEQAAARAFPGSLFDRRDAALRGLIRLSTGGEAAVAERLREIHTRLTPKHPFAIGLSNRCDAPGSYPNGFSEADHAVAAASVVSSEPGVVGFDDLGAYKYLLKVSQDGRVRDRRGEALQQLADYDRRHRSQLLADAGGVPAAPRQHRGGRLHAVCAPQHPPAAAAPHPGPDGAGRRPRGLADDRDRAEAAQARRSARQMKRSATA